MEFWHNTVGVYNRGLPTEKVTKVRWFGYTKSLGRTLRSADE